MSNDTYLCYAGVISRYLYVTNNIISSWTKPTGGVIGGESLSTGSDRLQLSIIARSTGCGNQRLTQPISHAALPAHQARTDVVVCCRGWCATRRRYHSRPNSNASTSRFDAVGRHFTGTVIRIGVARILAGVHFVPQKIWRPFCSRRPQKTV